MAFRKRPIATGIAALLFSGYVSALGLGEIRLNSSLNEPLDAEIPLLNMGELTEDEILAGLASNQDFANAGVDKELILTTLMFKLDTSAPGGPILRIMSKKPIREPYLDFLVDVQWPTGRLLREYTLLLDLPVYAGGTSKKKVEQPVAGGSHQSSRQQVARQPSPDRRTPSRPDIAAGDEEYVVRSGDTLWGIATSLQADASIHDRMDAIQQINPDAFINGDKNLLKRGAVLRLPDYGAMDSRLAGRGSQPDSTEFTPQLSGSGRDTAPGSPPPAGGRLTLEAGDESGYGGSSMGSGAGNTSGLRGDIAVLQEELDRSRRENSELKQRLSSLEDQITTMQRLMEISDDDLRAIQLAEAGEEGLADQIAEEVLEEETGGESFTPPGDPFADGEEVDSPALALFPSASDARRREPAPPDDTAGAAGEGDGGAGGVNAPGTPAEQGGVQASDQQEVAGQTEDTEPAAPSMKTDFKTEEGWFDKVNGYLLALLGIVVVVGGAIAAFVWRKGRTAEEQYDEPVRERYEPPMAPVRERPREETPAPPPEPQAASIDDIDLKAGDDLFEEPVEEPAAAPEPLAEPAGKVSGDPESLEEMELDLSEFDLEEAEEAKPDVEFDESTPEPIAREDLNLDEEFDFLGDIDEGDTQLELAQAYIEMGDHAGAREILQEVADSGSDEQKNKARQLLDQMS